MSYSSWCQQEQRRLLNRECSKYRLVQLEVVMFYTKEGQLHWYFLQMWYQDSVCYWSSVFHQSIFFQIVTGKVKDESGKNKKEDRRKKATGGKSGGGTQGRETKTKAVKNKHKGRKGASRDSDSEDDTPPPQPSGSGKFPHVEFLSLEDLQTEITNFSELADCPEELVESLASELNPVLTRQFQDVAQSAFLATVSAGSDARKKTHQQLVEKVSALLTSIRLAEKSIKVCSNWVLYDDWGQIVPTRLQIFITPFVNEFMQFLCSSSAFRSSMKRNRYSWENTCWRPSVLKSLTSCLST